MTKKKREIFAFLGKKGNSRSCDFFFFLDSEEGYFGGNVNRKKESSKDEKKITKHCIIYIYISVLFIRFTFRLQTDLYKSIDFVGRL